VKKVAEITLHQEPAEATYLRTHTMAAAAGVNEGAEGALGENFHTQPRSQFVGPYLNKGHLRLDC
jgi:hypothetical protein